MPRCVVSTRPEPLSVGWRQHLKSMLCFFWLQFHWLLQRCLKSTDWTKCIWSLRHSHCTLEVWNLDFRSKLEKLQSEIVLKLSKYHVDLVAIIGLHLPFIKAIIVLRKISFLAKLQESKRDDLAFCVFWTLSVDVYSISVVEQCRWLLEELGLWWKLQKCQMTSNAVNDLWNIILRHDWSQLVNSAKNLFTVLLSSLTCLFFLLSWKGNAYELWTLSIIFKDFPLYPAPPFDKTNSNWTWRLHPQ